MPKTQRYVQTKLGAFLSMCNVFPRFFDMSHQGEIACPENRIFHCGGATPPSGRRVRLELSGGTDRWIQRRPCSCPWGGRSEILALGGPRLFTQFRYWFAEADRDERLSTSSGELYNSVYGAGAGGWGAKISSSLPWASPASPPDRRRLVPAVVSGGGRCSTDMAWQGPHVAW